MSRDWLTECKHAGGRWTNMEPFQALYLPCVFIMIHDYTSPACQSTSSNMCMLGVCVCVCVCARAFACVCMCKGERKSEHLHCFLEGEWIADAG